MHKYQLEYAKDSTSPGHMTHFKSRRDMFQFMSDLMLSGYTSFKVRVNP